MTDSTMTEIPGRMSAELREALERAKGYKMSPEEIFEQKVSFVYGQQDHDNPNPKSKDEIRQMLIESQGRPACEKCAEAAAMLKAAVEALEPFAAIKADDGDDFSGYPDEVVIRCEVTAREIRKARNTLASVKQPPQC